MNDFWKIFCTANGHQGNSNCFIRGAGVISHKRAFICTSSETTTLSFHVHDHNEAKTTFFISEKKQCFKFKCKKENIIHVSQEIFVQVIFDFIFNQVMQFNLRDETLTELLLNIYFDEAIVIQVLYFTKPGITGTIKGSYINSPIVSCLCKYEKHENKQENKPGDNVLKRELNGDVASNILEYLVPFDSIAVPIKDSCIYIKTNIPETEYTKTEEIIRIVKMITTNIIMSILSFFINSSIIYGLFTILFTLMNDDLLFIHLFAIYLFTMNLISLLDNFFYLVKPHNNRLKMMFRWKDKKTAARLKKYYRMFLTVKIILNLFICFMLINAYVLCIYCIDALIIFSCLLIMKTICKIYTFNKVFIGTNLDEKTLQIKCYILEIICLFAIFATIIILKLRLFQQQYYIYLIIADLVVIFLFCLLENKSPVRYFFETNDNDLSAVEFSSLLLNKC